MNVGIGILTRNRCEQMFQVLKAIERYTTCRYDFMVVSDRSTDDTVSELEHYFRPQQKPSFTDMGMDQVYLRHPVQPGIAGARNTIFHKFRDKDIIFMFEDDFMPVEYGWQERFVKILGQGVYPALFALDEAGHGPVLDERPCMEPDSIVRIYDKVLYRDRLTTQMLCINTKLLDTLGYFNPEYGTRYGYEDSEWGSRGRYAELFGSTQGFPCIEQEGLFAHIPNPPSSDGKTEEERQADIKVNFPTFASFNTRPTFLAYPYETSVD